MLINRDLPNLKAVLEKADVVLELLDTRDPHGVSEPTYRNTRWGAGKEGALGLDENWCVFFHYLYLDRLKI